MTKNTNKSVDPSGKLDAYSPPLPLLTQSTNFTRLQPNRVAEAGANGVDWILGVIDRMRSWVCCLNVGRVPIWGVGSVEWGWRGYYWQWAWSVLRNIYDPVEDVAISEPHETAESARGVEVEVLLAYCTRRMCDHLWCSALRTGESETPSEEATGLFYIGLLR